MTRRLRSVLLVVAGAPGVVALFLPVGFHVVPIDYYWEQLQDGVVWPPSGLVQLWGMDWMVALPVAVLLLQARRLLSDQDLTRLSVLALLLITMLFQLGAVAFALYMLTQIRWSLPRGWLEFGPEALYIIVPMLALSAGNVWLLYRNWRRADSTTSTTEMFMMGTYMVAQSFWLTGLLTQPVVAPKLMLWTCLVYAVTIVFRLRDSRSAGGRSSDAGGKCLRQRR